MGAAAGADPSDGSSLSVFTTNSRSLAAELESGAITPTQGAQRAVASGGAIYLYFCGLTFRRNVRRVSYVGKQAQSFDYGARIGGPTVVLPGFGPENPFASCNKDILMAVQSELLNANTGALISSAARNPASGLVLAHNLYSGKTTEFITGRKQVQVHAMLHVAVPTSQINDYVVGVTYDPRTTQRNSIHCSAPTPRERQCALLSDAFQ